MFFFICFKWKDKLYYFLNDDLWKKEQNVEEARFL